MSSEPPKKRQKTKSEETWDVSHWPEYKNWEFKGSYNGNVKAASKEDRERLSKLIEADEEMETSRSWAPYLALEWKGVIGELKTKGNTGDPRTHSYFHSNGKVTKWDLLTFYDIDSVAGDELIPDLEED